MKARKFLIFIIILVLLLLTFFGMNSINAIDNLAYVVSMGFDIKDSGKLELSFQIAIPSGSSGSSSSDSSQSSDSIINSVECNTLESGINLVNSYLGKKLNLYHCKAIVFSEEIAAKGIGEYLYTLVNNIEIRPTCNVIISRCNAKYFLNNSKPMLEQLSSKYYEVSSTSERSTGYTSDTTLQEFFSSMTDTFGEAYAILGSVNDGINTGSDAGTSGNTDNENISSETPIDTQKNIETLGVAVFKGDKLVGELNGLESIAQLIIKNDLKDATLSIPSPFESTNFIDLYIEKSKSNSKVNLPNGSPYISSNIEISARIISMSDDYKYLDEQTIEVVEQYASNYIKSFITDFVYKTSKEFKSDISCFGRYAVTKFPTWNDWKDYNWLENYQNAFFNIDVNVDVKSRYLIIDT